MKSASRKFPRAIHPAEEFGALAQRLNEEHNDALALLGRFACDRAADTNLVLLHPAGLVLRIQEGVNQTQTFEVPFEKEAATTRAAEAEVTRLVIKARAGVGDAMPLTRFEAQRARSSALRIQRARVASRRVLSPRLFSLSVDLEDANFVSPGFDASLFVYAPTTPGSQSLLEQGFTMTQYRAMPEHRRPAGAYLTIRGVRDNRVDLWCVRHGQTPPGVLAWAWQAKPGDLLAFWGPRTAFEAPAGTDHYLLVADESSLAAAFGVIEALPPSVRVQLLAECSNATEQLPPPTHPKLRVHWCHRDGVPAGASHALTREITQLPLRGDGLYVFGAGEAGEMAKLTGTLLNHHGLDRRQIHLSGYWRVDPRNDFKTKLWPRQ